MPELTASLSGLSYFVKWPLPRAAPVATIRPAFQALAAMFCRPILPRASSGYNAVGPSAPAPPATYYYTLTHPKLTPQKGWLEVVR